MTSKDSCKMCNAGATAHPVNAAPGFFLLPASPPLLATSSGISPDLHDFLLTFLLPDASHCTDPHSS